MTHTTQSWRTYEQVARAVLRDLRKQVGISDVTGYKELPGNSGTSWRVEGTATRANDDGILIIECRRYTSQGLNQESLGGLAFRITDTNSAGGIIVTPLPLQHGAELVASSQNISHVRLEPWSTSEDYLAEFMGTHFHHATVREHLKVTDTLSVQVIKNGERSDGCT